MPCTKTIVPPSQPPTASRQKPIAVSANAPAVTSPRCHPSCPTIAAMPKKTVAPIIASVSGGCSGWPGRPCQRSLSFNTLGLFPVGGGRKQPAGRRELRFLGLEERREGRVLLEVRLERAQALIRPALERAVREI